MPTFVLVTKLSTQGLGEPDKRENVGRKWLEAVKTKCPEVKWLHHYALLGPYDFIDIYEAPNEEVAAKVSMITMSLGAVKAESWAAIPYKRFLEIAREL
ncbi:MAG: GYD domain-containing protein [Ignavibacteria bacterium]|nr:GYD domain-containing protein [Ignavibacteria bacterium]